MRRTRGVLTLAFLWLMAVGVCRGAAAGEAHQVSAKKGTVEKNGEIDYEDCETAQPESVETAAGGKIVILSKTYKPPAQMDFRPFQGTGRYADIMADPSGLPKEEVAPSGPTQVKVKGVFLQAAWPPGSFPLRAEGNLTPTGPGVGPPPELHWSAMADSCKVELSMTPDLWWFCGAPAPAGYSLRSTVTATVTPPMTGGTYEWTLTAVSNEARIFDKGKEVTSATTTDPSITLVSKSWSRDRDQVVVTVQYQGCAGTLRTAVRRPYGLVLEKVTHLAADPLGGYRTWIDYVLFDNLGDDAPNMPVNETFGAEGSDWTDENWRWGPPGSYRTDGQGSFRDQILKSPLGDPRPLNPQRPLRQSEEDKVDHLEQTWFAGSRARGRGCRVQTDLIQRYIDHAEIHDIVSPVD